MTTPNAADVPQYPANLGGPKGAFGFVTSSKSFFSGATGLVATSYGMPGMGLTRVATGSYRIYFPPTKAVDFYAGVEAPTGNPYSINISEIRPGSGTANLQIGRIGQPGSSGSVAATLTFVPHNPVSGTIVNILGYWSPKVAY